MCQFERRSTGDEDGGEVADAHVVLKRWHVGLIISLPFHSYASGSGIVECRLVRVVGEEAVDNVESAKAHEWIVGKGVAEVVTEDGKFHFPDISWSFLFSATPEEAFVMVGDDVV